MTTKEFIKKVEELDFYVEESNFGIHIFEKNDKGICSFVSGTNVAALNTNFVSFRKLEDNLKQELLGLITEYAKTPIEDREEPKKYYLKIEIDDQNFRCEISGYLNKCKVGGRYTLSSKGESLNYQTQFTQAEIDQIPEDIRKHFIQVEVENE